MNKKFSTLVAGVLLAASVGTVNAQSYAVATASTPINKMESGKYYQLKSGVANALAMKAVGGRYHLEMVTLVGASLPETMWKIVSTPNAEGGISFTFVNVATGIPLGFDPNTASAAPATGANPTIPAPTSAVDVIGSTLWKWQPALTSVANFSDVALTTSFKADSIMTLAGTGANVAPVKYAAGNVPATITDQIKVQPVAAGTVVLTADDLNSMLWTQPYNTGKMKLTFDKDVENNVKENFFTSQAYKAVPAVGFPAEAPTATAPGTGVTNVTALVTAETNLLDGKADEALAKAVSDAISANYAANKADAFAALAAIEAIDATGVANKQGLVTKIEAVTISAPTSGHVTLPAIKAAVIAFVNAKSDVVSDKTTAEALRDEAVKSSATTGIAFNVANAADVSAMATAVKVYTDAITTPNTGLQAVYEAAYATAKTAFATTAAANGWVSLQANEETDPAKIVYLAVDTAFVTQEAGNKHLTFAQKKFKDVGADLSLPANHVTRMDLNGRFNFQFQYFPSADSLVIRTAGFAKKENDTKYWTQMTTTTNPADLGITKADVTPSSPSATNLAENNLIKIAVLADDHREVTVGSSEYVAGGTPASTVNTRIFLNYAKDDNRTTLASGLYFLKLKSDLASRQKENGAYKIVTLSDPSTSTYAKEDEAQLLGTIQNFGYMPATQWVVEQSAFGEVGKQSVSIYNREYPAIKIENIQLYTDGKGGYALPYGSGFFVAADTLEMTPVKTVKPEAKAAYSDTYLGYVWVDSMTLDEKMFNLDYLSGIKMGNYVNVLDSKTDTLIRVDMKGDKVNLVLETAPIVAEGDFGYDGALTKGTNKLFPELRRTAYNIKVKDPNKLLANYKYVVAAPSSATGETMYVISNVKKSEAAVFFLKENNRVVTEEKEVPYYALVEATRPASDWVEGSHRAGIEDGPLLMTQENRNEKRVAAFALSEDDSPLYRRLGVSDPTDGFTDMTTDTAKIYRINATAREYLYEDAHSVYSKEKKINFLGVEGKGDAKDAALFVDTAYVRGNTNMPQYLFAVDATVVPAGLMCPENPEHNTPEYIANHGDCGHKVQTQGYVMGRYLVNAEDSVQLAKNKSDYQWNNNYTRLIFVQAKHIGDTLVVCRNGKPSTLSADSIFLGDNQHNKPTTERPYGIKNPVFALRLINDDPACDFLIESAGNHKIPTNNTGKWIAIKNGVPVVAAYNTYNDAVLDAERFNIEKTADTPTANEGIMATKVTITAVAGGVQIKNAEGKTVTISNILGKTVANVTLTSDSETINVPAGIVVVAVEGEEAVKTIVK